MGVATVQVATAMACVVFMVVQVMMLLLLRGAVTGGWVGEMSGPSRIRELRTSDVLIHRGWGKWQLYIEARDAQKEANKLVTDDMNKYNDCWDKIMKQPNAASKLDRIKKTCAEATAKALRDGHYSEDPVQRFPSVNTERGGTADYRYAVLLKLLELAGDLNTVVQALGQRWANVGEATGKGGFKKVWVPPPGSGRNRIGVAGCVLFATSSTLSNLTPPPFFPQGRRAGVGSLYARCLDLAEEGACSSVLFSANGMHCFWLWSVSAGPSQDAETGDREGA